MSAVVAFPKASWTPDMEKVLQSMADAGATSAEIAEALGVSPLAAQTKMSRLGARPSLDAMTQEAVAEKVELGWRYSRIALQHGIPEAMIPSIVEAVKTNSHILSNDRRGGRFGEPLPRGRPAKPRAAWTYQTPIARKSNVKNRLSDLNDHLFMQLERLADEDLDDAALEKEAVRSRAMVDVADKIIQNGNLSLQAAKLVAGHGADPTPYLGTIEVRAAARQVEDRS
jgi:hypothetical protein